MNPLPAKVDDPVMRIRQGMPAFDHLLLCAFDLSKVLLNDIPAFISILASDEKELKLLA